MYMFFSRLEKRSSALFALETVIWWLNVSRLNRTYISVSSPKIPPVISRNPQEVLINQWVSGNDYRAYLLFLWLLWFLSGIFWLWCISLEYIVHTKDNLWMPPKLLIPGVSEQCQVPYRAEGQQGPALCHIWLFRSMESLCSQKFAGSLLSSSISFCLKSFLCKIQWTWGLDVCLSFLPLINQALIPSNRHWCIWGWRSVEVRGKGLFH